MQLSEREVKQTMVLRCAHMYALNNNKKTEWIYTKVISEQMGL